MMDPIKMKLTFEELHLIKESLVLLHDKRSKLSREYFDKGMSTASREQGKQAKKIKNLHKKLLTY